MFQSRLTSIYYEFMIIDIVNTINIFLFYLERQKMLSEMKGKTELT